MSNYKEIILMVLMLLCTVFTQEEFLLCYTCSSLDNHTGRACDSPINPRAVDYMGCFAYSDIHNSDMEFLCVKLTYNKDGVFNTDRGCAYKQFNNEDTCTYFKEMIENETNSTFLTCQTCNTHLCNSF